MTVRFEPPGVCPVCGEDVPPNARACPGCGSCPGSGWSEDAAYDALDLPGQDFDYEAFVGEEFGVDSPPRRRRPARWVVAVAILLLLLWFLIG
jgi:hypothetical protein